MQTIKNTPDLNPINHFDAKMFGVGKVKVKLPSADVLALGTAVDVLPAPGVGFAWKCIGMSTEIKTYGTAAYATNTTLQVKSKTGNKAQFQDAIGLTKTSAGIVAGTIVAPAAVGDKQIVDNDSLQLVVSGGNPSAGDSTVYVYLDVVLVDIRDNY